ncbi:hypothetical protein HDU98_010668 [Podochytrium sp. JEL0797]|nr:hypothetical protein HDU98_010668 [Podochytrium sp. JEL0797]
MGVGEAFMTFINRGNVVDLAVGIVVGGAFTAIVKSFVSDLISPIIGLATQKNLANLFLVIHCPKGKNATLAINSLCKTGTEHPYTTVLQANKAGATTWNYGAFCEAVINFFLVALAMFFVVQLYSNSFLKPKPVAVTTKPCSESEDEDEDEEKLKLEMFYKQAHPSFGDGLRYKR